MSLLERWKQWAVADAESRGLPGLRPMLDGLAASLARLRSIDWNEELRRQTAPEREGGGS